MEEAKSGLSLERFGQAPLRLIVPSSKSFSQRALIAAALAPGKSTLSNLSESDDLKPAIAILASCGAVIERINAGEYLVQGLANPPEGGKASTPLDCDMGESGASCRLLTAVLATGQGYFYIHGKGRLHERPIEGLAVALEGLGAKITYASQPGCPPFLLAAAGLCPPSASGGEPNGVLYDVPEGITVNCGQSGQFLSGLLLAAPLSCGALPLMPITGDGAPVPSWPYVNLTLHCLLEHGLQVRVEKRQAGAASWSELPQEVWQGLTTVQSGVLRLTVSGTYKPGSYRVEGDWSAASYLLAAGALGPRPVAVSGLNPYSWQGDRVIVDILRRMGAHVEWITQTAGPDHTCPDQAWPDQASDQAGPACLPGRYVPAEPACPTPMLVVSPAPLQGIEVDLSPYPDLAPTVAALAASACGPSLLRNVGNLRFKESDRLAALSEELSRAGCLAVIQGDDLAIMPAPGKLRADLADILFRTHNDHRMAMALSLLGLGGARPLRIRLDNPACVGKSFPDFWIEWEKILQGNAGV